MVVRPVAKSAVTLLHEPPRLEALEEPRQRVQLLPESGSAESAENLAAQALPDALRRPPALENRGLLDQVAGQIRREPQESTRLLESWLHEPAQGRRG